MDESHQALERIRAHCDSGMSTTWALPRMPSIPEQAEEVPHVQNLLSGLALVLAYVEGATDERSTMIASDEIVKRYAEIIQQEAWEPPFRNLNDSYVDAG